MSKLYPTHAGAYKKRAPMQPLRDLPPVDPRRNPWTGRIAPVRIDDDPNDEKPEHYNTDL